MPDASKDKRTRQKKVDNTHNDAQPSTDQWVEGAEEKEVITDRTQEALREIRGLTSRLIETSRATLFRAEEDRALQGALQELRGAARDIGNALGLELRREAPPAYSATSHPAPIQERGCGCEPNCETIAPDCCCFEIILLRARVMVEQGMPEIADGAGPGTGNQLELIFNVLADGEGEVYPSLVSHIAIEKKQKWVWINKRLRKICIRCNETRTVPLTVEIMEIEENVAGGRPEFGTNFGSLTLKCGCPTVPEQVSVELTGGGITGGEILVEIGARQL